MFIPVAAGVLLIATVAFAQKVTTDFDPGTNFSQFHTYAWAKGTPARNPLVDQRIVAGIESQLAAKGLQKAASQQGVDLLVIYHAAQDVQTEINTYNSGGWGGWYWGGGMTQTSIERIPVGELVVDLADVKNKKFVWRGKATATISSRPEKMNKTLDKALTKMFEKYPPKAKG
jgi:hypothetical protein